MGQYHKTYSLPSGVDNQVFTFEHYALGAGAKLLEQHYCWTYIDPELTRVTPPLASPFAAALATLVVLGPWRGRPLVVAGDYYEGYDYGSFYGTDPGEFVVTGTKPDDLTSYKLVDQTAMVTAVCSESFGWTFEADGATPWLDMQVPKDWFWRVEKLKAMHNPEPDLVIMSDVGEYFELGPFGTPSNRISGCIIGGAWPVAFIMCAVSDGLGGGDARWEPAGRWGGSVIGMVSRDEATRGGAKDITPWILMQNEAVYFTPEGHRP